MSDYRIFETTEFSRRFAVLPSREARMIRAKLDEYTYPQLRKEPFFGPNVTKLAGYSPDMWRYRIGRFRIFYDVNAETRIVRIISISLRRDAYR